MSNPVKYVPGEQGPLPTAAFRQPQAVLLRMHRGREATHVQPTAAPSQALSQAGYTAAQLCSAPLPRRTALPSPPARAEARWEARRGRATCRFGLLLPREAGAHEGPGVPLSGELLEAGGGELVHLLLTLRPATQGAGVRLARDRPDPARPGGSPRCRGPCLTRCGRRPSAGPCALRRTCCHSWRRNRSD